MPKKNNKIFHYQVIWASCSNCHKIIKRIGVYREGYLIGYLGNNCKYCGLSEKADENNIDYIQTRLPIPKKPKTLVWRRDE